MKTLFKGFKSFIGSSFHELHSHGALVCITGIRPCKVQAPGRKDLQTIEKERGRKGRCGQNRRGGERRERKGRGDKGRGGKGRDHKEVIFPSLYEQKVESVYRMASSWPVCIHDAQSTVLWLGVFTNTVVAA